MTNFIKGWNDNNLMAQKHGEAKVSVIDKLVKLMSMVSAEHLLINQLIRSISFEQAQLVELTALD
jgi:hypothetical protein